MRGEPGGPRLFDELASAADHRQINVLGAAMVGRREADDKVAEIDVVHAFERRDQFLAGEILAGAPESLDHHFGDDEPLETGEIEVGDAGFAQYLPVLLHDLNARAPGKGHDLRNRDTVAVVLQRVGERRAPDKGNIVKLGGAPGFFHLSHELGDRGVGGDHYHAVGSGRIDDLDGFFNLDRIALHLAEGGNLQIALADGDVHALQTRLPIGVVLVEHRDFLVRNSWRGR